MRILIIHLRRVGDMVLTTPVLRALRRRFPKARLEALVAAKSASVLAGNPDVDEVLMWHGGLGSHLRLSGELRRRKYDAVIDFHSSARTSMLVAATGAAQRIGERTGTPADLVYTTLLPPQTGPRYVADKWLGFTAPLGTDEVSRRDFALEIGIGSAERAWAEREWQRLGLSGDQPVVAVSAVSKEYFKQWGLERWVKIADAVQDDGYRVLLTHGPSERDQAASVGAQMRSPPAWDHGETTPAQLAALYERCTLWIGNDGGPKHIAAAAGIPTVAVHRWTIGPEFTDTSQGSPHRYVEHSPSGGCDLRCRSCSHLTCLAEVSVEDVLEVVRASLRSAAPLISR
jgi:ADP-heptose:LPS heptosyltransferase